MTPIENALLSAKKALDRTIANKSLLKAVEDVASRMAEGFRKGQRVFSCGNGGSLCDAMHFAEELSGRFRKDRPPLPALSITDPAHLSCVANDFGYEHVFERFIEAHGQKGDTLLGISTSGSSPNVLKAAQKAQEMGLFLVTLTGRENSPLGALASVDLCTPGGTRYSDRTQELHIKIIHILIELIEQNLFPENDTERKKG